MRRRRQKLRKSRFQVKRVNTGYPRGGRSAVMRLKQNILNGSCTQNIFLLFNTAPIFTGHSLSKGLELVSRRDAALAPLPPKRPISPSGDAAATMTRHSGTNEVRNSASRPMGRETNRALGLRGLLNVVLVLCIPEADETRRKKKIGPMRTNSKLALERRQFGGRLVGPT